MLRREQDPEPARRRSRRPARGCAVRSRRGRSAGRRGAAVIVSRSALPGPSGSGSVMCSPAYVTRSRRSTARTTSTYSRVRPSGSVEPDAVPALGHLRPGDAEPEPEPPSRTACRAWRRSSRSSRPCGPGSGARPAPRSMRVGPGADPARAWSPRRCRTPRPPRRRRSRAGRPRRRARADRRDRRRPSEPRLSPSCIARCTSAFSASGRPSGTACRCRRRSCHATGGRRGARLAFGPMEQRRLGGTGLHVSRLGLGTMTWGRDTDEHEAREQVVAFVEAGGTLVDTAAGYGDGESERVLGALLADVRRPRRGRPHHEGGHLAPVAASASSTRRAGRCSTSSTARSSASAPTTWTCGSCTPGATTRRWRRRWPPWTSRCPAGVRATSGCPTTPGGRPRGRRPGSAPGSAVRRSPRRRSSTPSCSARSSARCSRPRPRSALGVLPWSPLGRGVLTGKYRQGVPADSRAASPHFEAFVEQVPRRPLAPDRRRRGDRSGRARRHAAGGRAGLGAGPPRGHRADRRRPHRRAAPRRAGGRGPRAPDRDPGCPRRGVRPGGRLPRSGPGERRPTGADRNPAPAAVPPA